MLCKSVEACQIVDGLSAYFIDSSSGNAKIFGDLRPAFLEKVNHAHVKLLVDTFHMNIEEDDMVEAILLAGDRLGHFHVGENNRRLPGKGGMPWYQIGSALRAIGYDKNVVMEPFVRSGGGVGSDIKVWRDLSKGADEQRLDLDAAASVAYLRNVFSGPNSDYTSVLR